MNNKAYVVMQGCYSDRHIVKVCLDEQLAKQIRDIYNRATNDYNPYYIEEYEISHTPVAGWIKLECVIKFTDKREVIYFDKTDPDDVCEYDIYYDKGNVRTHVSAERICEKPEQFFLKYEKQVSVQSFAEDKLGEIDKMVEETVAKMFLIYNDRVAMDQMRKGSKVTLIETED